MNKFKIIKDTREKTGWKFRASANCEGMEIKKLDTGDYSIEGFEHLVMIERKSIPDLWGTLLQRKKPFLKEMERAKNYPLRYLIIEGSYKDLRKGFRYSKVSPEYILSMLIQLEVNYGIHVIFTDKRPEIAQEYARKLMSKLFQYCEEGLVTDV